jgi:hypothetical protein
VVWLILCAVIAFVVIRFCAVYLTVSFFSGALVGLAVFIGKLSPKTMSNFEAFSHTYCRFVDDDNLRSAMSAADLPKIRSALRALGADVRIDLKN